MYAGHPDDGGRREPLTGPDGHPRPMAEREFDPRSLLELALPPFGLLIVQPSGLDGGDGLAIGLQHRDPWNPGQLIAGRLSREQVAALAECLDEWLMDTGTRPGHSRAAGVTSTAVHKPGDGGR